MRSVVTAVATHAAEAAPPDYGGRTRSRPDENPGIIQTLPRVLRTGSAAHVSRRRLVLVRTDMNLERLSAIVRCDTKDDAAEVSPNRRVTAPVIAGDVDTLSNDWTADQDNDGVEQNTYAKQVPAQRRSDTCHSSE